MTHKAESQTAHHCVDARNLLCPMPVIRLQTAAADAADGELIELTATDPGTGQDIPAWCRVHGHTLLETLQRDGEFVFRVRVQQPSN